MSFQRSVSTTYPNQGNNMQMQQYNNGQSGQFGQQQPSQGNFYGNNGGGQSMGHMQHNQSMGNMQQNQSMGHMQHNQSMGNMSMQHDQSMSMNNTQMNNNGMGYQQQQEPCGCCGPQQQGQAPSMCPCCPAHPEEHCCSTDPNIMQGSQCLWQFCDFTTWLVGFFVFATIIGFGLTVGLKDRDNLLEAYGASSARDLDSKMYYDNLNNLDAYRWSLPKGNATTAAPATTMAPPPTNTTTSPAGVNRTDRTRTRTLVRATRAPRSRTKTVVVRRRRRTRTRSQTINETAAVAAVLSKVDGVAERAASTRRRLQQQSPPASTMVPAPQAVECRNSSKMVGLFGGTLCMEDTMDATVMLLNLSRFINFRATCYFIAMMGTIILFVLVVVVNKQIHPMGAPVQTPQGQGQQANQMGMMGPPWSFYTTNFYYAFRLTWGTLSAIFFLWFCNEMYYYWWFIDYYCDRSQGRLNTFWNKFDTKHMWTLCIVFVYLCWPLCHMVLELVWFIIFGLFWAAIRLCLYPQVTNPRTLEIKQDDQSCCMRSEMFFCECNQAKRCGFSEGQWLLLTGTRTPFFTCCDMMMGGQQPQMGGGNNNDDHVQTNNFGVGQGTMNRGGSIHQAPGRVGSQPGFGGPSPSQSQVMSSSNFTPSRSSGGAGFGSSPSNQFGAVEESMVVDPSTGVKKKKKKKKADGDVGESTEKKKKKKKKAEGLVSDSDF